MRWPHGGRMPGVVVGTAIVVYPKIVLPQEKREIVPNSALLPPPPLPIPLPLNRRTDLGAGR